MSATGLVHGRLENEEGQKRTLGSEVNHLNQPKTVALLGENLLLRRENYRERGSEGEAREP